MFLYIYGYPHDVNDNSLYCEPTLDGLEGHIHTFYSHVILS